MSHDMAPEPQPNDYLPMVDIVDSTGTLVSIPSSLLTYLESRIGTSLVQIWMKTSDLVFEIDLILVVEMNLDDVDWLYSKDLSATVLNLGEKALEKIAWMTELRSQDHTINISLL
jgi:hypothetical protein